MLYDCILYKVLSLSASYKIRRLMLLSKFTLTEFMRRLASKTNFDLRFSKTTYFALLLIWLKDTVPDQKCRTADAQRWLMFLWHSIIRVGIATPSHLCLWPDTYRYSHPPIVCRLYLNSDIVAGTAFFFHLQISMSCTWINERAPPPVSGEPNKWASESLSGFDWLQLGIFFGHNAGGVVL